MKETIVMSITISIVYCIYKFIEMRFVTKNSVPIKYLVRDSIIVCFSVISGLFLIQQIGGVQQNLAEKIGGDTPVLVGDADF